MSKIKKIFSVFVAMLMLLSAFPIIPVFAETESGKCGENTVWEYNAETSTLTISGIGDMYDYELYESPWRKAGIKEINEVILEDGIRYIGNCSFAGISINTLTLPPSIVELGERAFECKGPSRLNISSFEWWFEIDFANYSSNPFSHNTALYVNNRLIESIEIPSTVNKLKPYVFSKYKSEKTIFIPENIISLDYKAFSANNITNIVVSKNNNVYYSDSNCVFERETKKLILGNSKGDIPSKFKFETIGEYAFYDCSFKSLTIPEGVRSIEANAFASNICLTDITIPNSLESINETSFSECYYIRQINISDLKNWCKIDFGNINMFGKVDNWLFHSGGKLCLNGEVVSNLVIPNGITEIKNGAFAACKNITGVTIPDSVTKIGNSAFYGCNNLKDVTMSKSVTALGDYSFAGCSLVNIIIPENVTSIGSSAFAGCKSLESIEISPGINKICEGAFYNCQSLKKVNISDINAWCNIDFSYDDSYFGFDEYANPLYYAKHLYLNGEKITHLIIPDTVKKIQNGTFINCQSITEITIPDSVESIGNKAFFNCTELKGLAMPNSIKDLGVNAFSGCTNLTDLKLSANIKKIGVEAFSGCAIKELEIPNGITGIGKKAFANCSELTTVSLPESLEWSGENVFENCKKIDKVFITSLEKWCKIEFNDHYNDDKSNPLSCGADLYENGVLVEKLIIPNSITGIKGVSFQGCKSIKSVTIPSGVKYIAWCSFNSTHLKNVYIPKSVTYIGSYAFDDEITDIYYEGTQKEWNKINVDYYNLSNRVLQKAKIHYNSLGIYEYTPGDLDGNDEVTDADAEYLLMHTFFPDEYPVNQNCDFNNDGAVTDADAEYLLMFTFFPEEYPIN